MEKLKVLTLIGGISNNSINKRLFNEVSKYNNTNLEFQTFDIASLPFYSQDIEPNPPQSVKQLKEMAKNADAVLIISPEYNRSIPGVLKNALDWGSRPPAESCWGHKPAAIMGASAGVIGTFGMQQHLRNVCASLNLHVMNKPEFYFNASTGMNENGLTETSIPYVVRFLESFEKWIGVINRK